ncbi:MAG: hypothetical protein ABI216_21975 [Devosia sp.]
MNAALIAMAISVIDRSKEYIDANVAAGSFGKENLWADCLEVSSKLKAELAPIEFKVTRDE